MLTLLTALASAGTLTDITPGNTNLMVDFIGDHTRDAIKIPALKQVLVIGEPRLAADAGKANLYDLDGEAWKNVISGSPCDDMTKGILMDDGDVLIVGVTPGASFACSTIYDTVAKTFGPDIAPASGNFNDGDGGLRLTKLGSGDIVAFGHHASSTTLDKAWLFDVSLQQWVAMPDAPRARGAHNQHRLVGPGVERVYVFNGGADVFGAPDTYATEIDYYDVGTNTWGTSTAVTAAEARHRGSVKLQSQDVLLCGGQGALVNLTSCERFDVSTDTVLSHSTLPVGDHSFQMFRNGAQLRKLPGWATDYVSAYNAPSWTVDGCCMNPAPAGIHLNAAVKFQNKIYLFSGRGSTDEEVYRWDP